MDLRSEELLRQQLDEQDWECVAGRCLKRPASHLIKPGDMLARCFDGVGIVHLMCASIGQAPHRKPLEASFEKSVRDA